MSDHVASCQKFNQSNKACFDDVELSVISDFVGKEWSLDTRPVRYHLKNSQQLPNQIHTCANLISKVVTRAMSNSSKNYAFLMCWIWKMGWNLFSSLDIRDNSKVAFLEKKSNNPNICLVIGSGFIELSILWNCTTVLSWVLWVCLSVNLALTSCVELRPPCEIFVADCTCSWGLPLSSIDIFLSTAVAKCQQLQENSAADSICHIDYQI